MSPNRNRKLTLAQQKVKTTPSTKLVSEDNSAKRSKHEGTMSPTKNTSSGKEETMFSLHKSAAEICENSKRLEYGKSNTKLMELTSLQQFRRQPKLEEKLCPSVQIVNVVKERETFCTEIVQKCMQYPIVNFEGLTAKLKMNLDLFSTVAIREANPSHPVELRIQHPQSRNENVDLEGKTVWNFFSKRSKTTIAEYAEYQLNFSQEQKEKLEFGTNIDLSDQSLWEPQLEELKKLPPFARVDDERNMLSQVGHKILGMNTVQLYMKVPGSRTPGHQENNNFCSVNINIGPGDCEWFAVANDHWESIQRLCSENGIDYLKGSWWPNLDDCLRNKIPVIRGVQKAGEMIFIRSGCVHWVQALGVCNNVAWNVGPLVPEQYLLSMERYELNKIQKFRSLVPMVRLSWNIAKNIAVYQPEMFRLLKICLMRTLIQVTQIREYVKAKGKRIVLHQRSENEASPCCEMCLEEVFHILLVKKTSKTKKYYVHCFDCARRCDSNLRGYSCLEEDKLEDLVQIYDKFILSKDSINLQLDTASSH